MVKIADLGATKLTTNRTRLIGYCRVSTYHQEDRVSLDAQPADLKRYCAGRGFDFVKVVSEVESAFKARFEDRPGGAVVLDAIRSGEADGIIVTKLDRAFRSVPDAILTVEGWGREGISFICTDFLNGKPLEQIDDDPMARLMFTLFAGLAQFTRDVIAVNTKTALRHKLDKGEHVGRIPYGFRIGADGKLAEDSEQMANVRRMKREHHRGRSIRAIAAKYGVGKSTVQRLVSTDLRLLRNKGR